MRFMDSKNHLHDQQILDVLAYSLYMPAEEKLRSLADTYASDPHIRVFSCADNGCVMGVIVLKCRTMPAAEIVHIAVSPAFRGRGVGSSLVSFAVSRLGCCKVRAETDEEAVGFYRRHGFDAESLGEKHPGHIRYSCTLNVP